MKLRNKKTGEIVEDTDILGLLASAEYDIPLYHSLAELNNEWEDYTPKELPIEFKRVRKVVRDWAKINDITELKYNYDENSLEDIFRNTITFNFALGLKDGQFYNIEELCGDEG